jgi:hypothetical protein
MADLSDLNALDGIPLTEGKIQAILNQIDLDVLNLLRDGKLAASRYAKPGPGGETMDRAAGLLALLSAREKYEALLRSLPVWQTSQGVDADGTCCDG